MWDEMEDGLNDLVSFVHRHRLRLTVCSVPVVAAYKDECREINAKLQTIFDMSAVVKIQLDSISQIHGKADL